MDKILTFLLASLPGLAGGFVGGLFVVLVARAWRSYRRPDVVDPDESDSARSAKGLDARVQSVSAKHALLDVRIRELENGAKGRVNPDELRAKLKFINENIDTLSRNHEGLRKSLTALQQAPPQSSGGWRYAPTPASVDRDRHPGGVSHPADPGAPKLYSQPVPSQTPHGGYRTAPPPKDPPSSPPERRPPLSSLILQHFDDIDASSLRDLGTFRTTFMTLAGPELEDIVDKDGAYVFVSSDGTCYVHPKPNTTLTMVWEPAYPGASSYSRPIKKVVRLARIREQTDQEYEVIDRGSFEVVS